MEKPQMSCVLEADALPTINAQAAALALVFEYDTHTAPLMIPYLMFYCFLGDPILS